MAESDLSNLRVSARLDHLNHRDQRRESSRAGSRLNDAKANEELSNERNHTSDVRDTDVQAAKKKGGKDTRLTLQSLSVCVGRASVN